MMMCRGRYPPPRDDLAWQWPVRPCEPKRAPASSRAVTRPPNDASRQPIDRACDRILALAPQVDALDRVMLCIGCLQARLGRPLTQADFTRAPVNQDPRSQRSERLHALLGDIIMSPEAWALRKRGRPPGFAREGTRRTLILSPEAIAILDEVPERQRGAYASAAICLSASVASGPAMPRLLRASSRRSG